MWGKRMVDTPKEIQKDLDSNEYRRHDLDVSQRIRYAMLKGCKYITVEYHVCPKLEAELKSKGYNVRKTDNWFFGEQTTITW